MAWGVSNQQGGTPTDKAKAQPDRATGVVLTEPIDNVVTFLVVRNQNAGAGPRDRGATCNQNEFTISTKTSLSRTALDQDTTEKKRATV